jgi:hypothetical protein
MQPAGAGIGEDIVGPKKMQQESHIREFMQTGIMLPVKPVTPCR